MSLLINREYFTKAQPRVVATDEDVANAKGVIYKVIISQLWKFTNDAQIADLPEKYQEELRAVQSEEYLGDLLKDYESLELLYYPPRRPRTLIESVAKHTFSAFDLDSILQEHKFFDELVNLKIIEPYPGIEDSDTQCRLLDVDYVVRSYDEEIFASPTIIRQSQIPAEHILNLYNKIEAANNEKTTAEAEYWCNVGSEFYKQGMNKQDVKKGSKEKVRFARACFNFVGKKYPQYGVFVGKAKRLCDEALEGKTKVEK